MLIGRLGRWCLTGLRRAIEFLLIAWPMLDRVNELADHPEWYHLLSNNCTLNVVRYASRAAGDAEDFSARIRASLPAPAGK